MLSFHDKKWEIESSVQDDKKWIMVMAGQITPDIFKKYPLYAIQGAIRKALPENLRSYKNVKRVIDLAHKLNKV